MYRWYSSRLQCFVLKRSRVSNIEMIYETMCEENYLKLVREERDCMLQLESDEKLRECFVNQTNVLRDEYQENG
uniref:IDEAL domain-containing protein n=1 Tax=Heterorhabditis bacteriophora TaxID=37862 RepID=A0A1I7XRU9_HETBA